MIGQHPVKPLPPHTLPELRQVGKPLRRVDALGKAVGATVYAGDFSLPLMLHAKVFRSTQACARIVRLDVSKARDLPGVACVLTAADLPDVKLVSDMPGQTGQKQRSGSDVPVLAADQVRFYGEPIALVAAETLAIAERALKLIEIEYEVLPGVFDPLEALQPGATVENLPDPADPSLRNVVARWAIRKGDVNAGFAEADLIVENTFRVPYQEHAFIEPEAGVAWTDERGVLNIRVSTQVVEHFRSIARAVGIPQSQIRIQGTMVGGGFGGKEDITVEIYLALLTKATQRPVKLVYTREESTLAHSKRHPVHHPPPHRREAGRPHHRLPDQGHLRFGRVSVSEPLRAAVYHRNGAGPLPRGQRAGGFGRRGHQQPVHQRVPRLRRPAGVLRLRAADGRHRRCPGDRPLRAPPPKLRPHRRHDRHRPAHRDRGLAGGDGDAGVNAHSTKDERDE